MAMDNYDRDNYIKFTLNTEDDAKRVSEYIDKNIPKFCKVLQNIVTGTEFVAHSIHDNSLLMTGPKNYGKNPKKYWEKSSTAGEELNFLHGGLEMLQSGVEDLVKMFDPDGVCATEENTIVSDNTVKIYPMKAELDATRRSVQQALSVLEKYADFSYR